jgi:putative ABC transport system permease protein
MTSPGPRGLSPDPGNVPFPRRSLVHRRLRTALAVAGIGFAVLFMFLQLGFRATVENTARALPSHLDGEILLVSPRFVDLRHPDGVPRERLYQALSDTEVVSAAPLFLRPTVWRTPDRKARCEMLALGVALDGASPLSFPETTTLRQLLAQPDALLVDALTQPKCGPTAAGAVADINDRRRVRAVGQFRLGVGFLMDGAFVAGEPTYYELFGGHRLAQPQLGVVRLRPGARVEAVLDRLRRALPGDTRVLSRREFEAEQERFWLSDTAVGNMFTIGTLVGFMVGIVILYQILSTDIRNQLPQYATLKAMGYPDGRLGRFVLEQALLFGLLGYAPGFLLALAVYWSGRTATLLPLFMTTGRALGVLALTLAMCVAAGMLSARRLRTAEPADLF